VNWAELRRRFSDVKRLRNALRGLVRNDQLTQDQAGNYLVGAAERTLLTAVVTGRGRSLALAGVPLAPPSKPPQKDNSRLRLRAGDTVEYWVDNKLARVNAVLSYSQTPVVGVLAASRHGAYIDSLSPDYRGRVALDEMPANAELGATLAVRITGSDRWGLRGEGIEVVSRAAVSDRASESLLASHQVPLDWPDAALTEAAALPDKVQPGRFRGRRDLRDTPFVTIDGADARDFDDAVYCEPDSAGGWRLLVAIADVAHYVRTGSALDAAAYERGNSLYLPDRVVPMLPEVLSNGLCSLRPFEPRLVLVCEMTISPVGEILNYEFSEGLIQSWARLTYEQVSGWLSERTKIDLAAPLSTAQSQSRQMQIESSLDQLQVLLAAMLSARERRGGLEFATKSARLVLEEGRVVALEPVVRNAAHRLIEEAMIAANVCAARFVAASEACALYRVHEPPQSDKADLLRDALAYAGIRTRVIPSEPKALQELLAPLNGRDDAWLLYMMVLRSMSQARYQPENLGHFGLALEQYMHFTSPIRRYPDLLVHRVIKALVRGKRPPLQALDQLLQAGEHFSTTERRAEEVERGVSNWLKCDFVASRVGESFAGTVVGVAEFGLFVELDGYYVQGLVHVSELGDDFFTFVPLGMSLVGDRSGKRFQLGDKLRVVLMDAQPPLGKLELLLEERAGASGRGGSSSPSVGSARRRGRKR
jgi:ribonuclease R